MHLGTPIFLARASNADAGTGFDGLMTSSVPPMVRPRCIGGHRREVPLSSNYGQGKTRFLELRAVKEPCEDRRRLLEGVWEGILAD
jgi:hypothetical protein